MATWPASRLQSGWITDGVSSAGGHDPTTPGVESRVTLICSNWRQLARVFTAHLFDFLIPPIDFHGQGKCSEGCLLAHVHAAGKPPKGM